MKRWSVAVRRMPSVKLHRVAPFSALMVLACGGVASYGPATPAPTSPAALIDLYDDARVPGLDDRRFDHRTYWSAVAPYLNGVISSQVAGESAEGRPIRRRGWVG